MHVPPGIPTLEPGIALRRRFVAAALVVATVGALVAGACRSAAVSTSAAAALAATPAVVRLVAHTKIATGTMFENLEVGGLSGLTYDLAADLFYAVSDDPSGHPPARLLRFRWHPPAEPVLVDWVLLRQGDGPMPTVDADLEGVALRAGGELFVSSEGNVDNGLAPWVGRFDAGGRRQARLPLPEAFLPRPGHGVHQNQAFEALTVEPGDRTLIAGTEDPLVQDEPAPAGELGRTRLLRWDLRAGGPPRQWLYPVDPPHAAPQQPGDFATAGLVELLAAGDGSGRLLALERSYVDKMGFAVKLYEASLAGAEEVTGVDAVAGRHVGTASKRLLADFGALGVPMDNYEGMAWGPAGEGGEPLLVVVADNNFKSFEQTYLVAFQVTGGRASSASR